MYLAVALGSPVVLSPLLLEYDHFRIQCLREKEEDDWEEDNSEGFFNSWLGSWRRFRILLTLFE